MSKTKNIFISHHSADDKQLQDLKRRLSEKGYDARNSSVDSTKYQAKRPSNAVIERYLRRCINWGGKFICLIGDNTYKRPWVNYEIEQAYKLGKPIVGIYLHGCANDVELPEAFKKYGGTPLGWNSLDKLGEILDGKSLPPECPDGTPAPPIFDITRVAC